MSSILDIGKLVVDSPELGCVLYVPGLPGGSNKLYDRSPYCNIGTIIGATWKRSLSGLWTLYFDHQDDYVNCANDSSLNITTAGTWIVWGRISSILAVDAYYSIFWKGDRTPSPEVANYWLSVYCAANGEGYLAFWAKEEDGNWTNLTDDTTKLSDDTYYCLAATYNAGTVKLFVNGKNVKTGVLTISSLLTNTANLEIGRGEGGAGTPSYKWKDWMGLWYICNYAWSDLQMQNSFNREKHLFGVW